MLLVPPSRYCLCDAVLPVIEFQVKLYESFMRTCSMSHAGNDLWSFVSKRFEYKRSLNRGLLILFVFENWCWVTAKFIHSFRKLDVIFEKTQKPCRSCNLASYSYGQGPSNNKPYWNYHQRPKLTINQPLKLTKTCLTLFKEFKLVFNRWSVQRKKLKNFC